MQKTFRGCLHGGKKILGGRNSFSLGGWVDGWMDGWIDRMILDSLLIYLWQQKGWITDDLQLKQLILL